MGKGWIYRRLELNKLFKKLQSYPNIKVSRNINYFKVRFKNTQITEYWALNSKSYENRQLFCYRFPEHGPYFKSPIKTFKQFELDPFNPGILENHFLITRKQIKSAAWCDLRFKIHELVHELSEEQSIDCKYSSDLLKLELEELKKAKIENHETSLIRYNTYPPKLTTKGRRLRTQFLPWQDILEKHWRRKRTLYIAINSLVNGKSDITRENILRALESYLPQMVSPGYYRAIFKRYFQVKNKRIYDFGSDWGSKALAVALEGGTYVYEGKWGDQLSKLVQFAGGKFEKGSTGEAIILSDHRPLTAEEAVRRIKLYPNIPKILLVKSEELNKVLEVYEPEKVLRTDVNLLHIQHDDNIVIGYL